jgi:hypothetical protein
VFPRPNASSVHSSSADIQFKYTTTPFSFSIVRAHSNEVLFSTGRHPIVFEPQYLRLMTDLPRNPNIYGLGVFSVLSAVTHPLSVVQANTRTHSGFRPATTRARCGRGMRE